MTLIENLKWIKSIKGINDGTEFPVISKVVLSIPLPILYYVLMYTYISASVKSKHQQILKKKIESALFPAVSNIQSRFILYK